MNRERISEILSNKAINEVYYNEKPIWIQEVKNDIAKIGFLDGSQERNVYIDDLYEKINK